MTEIISIGYSKWDPELFKNYINKFGLDLDQNIDKLSKGMKMKFALALAFSHEAELYIMDEPTNGLDMIFREEILEFIKTEVLNSNKTVIFSTHLSSDVENIADYLLILNNGKVIFENTKSAFLNLPRLKNETTFKGKLLDLLRKGGE
jgi:ABC-2 type transport system ATP-binding protein